MCCGLSVPLFSCRTRLPLSSHPCSSYPPPPNPHPTESQRWSDTLHLSDIATYFNIKADDKTGEHLAPVNGGVHPTPEKPAAFTPLLSSTWVYVCEGKQRFARLLFQALPSAWDFAAFVCLWHHFLSLIWTVWNKQSKGSCSACAWRSKSQCFVSFQLYPGACGPFFPEDV